MSRAFIIMLDSFGIGALPDAAQYGDQGADTFGHLVKACHEGRADRAGLRAGPLHIPHLLKLGLHKAAELSQNQPILELATKDAIIGAYGCAAEKSYGKDTQSGHWEMAGVPVLFHWGYFQKEYPSFPAELLEQFIKEAQIPGVLGNCHASGTVIIEELGAEHQATGKPIVYTSADSVFQIAAHEETFGLERLYQISEIARKLVDPYNIGRVIARPFVGSAGHYQRTGNRRDYAVPPPSHTLLDDVVAAGHEVIAIGKVADIYAHCGISKTVKANGNDALFNTFLQEVEHAPQGSLTFVNLVDFDMLYGHRRDLAGYAHALEVFDKALPRLFTLMEPGDIALITADHGCDPTWPGSDHTREYVPVLFFGPTVKPGSLGVRASFADMGQTIAHHLGLKPLQYGEVCRLG